MSLFRAAELAALPDEMTVAPVGFYDCIITQAAATALSWYVRIAADCMQFLKTIIDRVIIQQAHAVGQSDCSLILLEVTDSKYPKPLFKCSQAEEFHPTRKFMAELSLYAVTLIHLMRLQSS